MMEGSKGQCYGRPTPAFERTILRAPDPRVVVLLRGRPRRDADGHPPRACPTPSSLRAPDGRPPAHEHWPGAHARGGVRRALVERTATDTHTGDDRQRPGGDVRAVGRPTRRDQRAAAHLFLRPAREGCAGSASSAPLPPVASPPARRDPNTATIIHFATARRWMIIAAVVVAAVDAAVAAAAGVGAGRCRGRRGLKRLAGRYGLIYFCRPRYTTT